MISGGLRCIHCQRPIVGEPWTATDGTRWGDCCLKYLLIKSAAVISEARGTPAEQAIGGKVVEMTGRTSTAIRNAKKR